MARLEIVPCPHCTDGSLSCRDCGGKGQISDVSFGNYQVTCTPCHGSGSLLCEQCLGTGQIERTTWAEE